MSYKLPSRRLVSQEDAAMTARPDVPRSKFVGSWTRKTTFDAGLLVPFMVEEVLPGDQLSYDVTAYVRMSTPLFPLMDNQRIDTFFFFVPNRLLWFNWPEFMGEQINPGDSIAFTIPGIDSAVGGFPAHSIYDHMGVPVAPQTPGAAIRINALPLRAYNQIYNQWFRDENLINSVPQNIGDGTDAVGAYTLQRRAKSHDYFTSALPWPQKFTAPLVPLSGLAPVKGLGVIAGSSFPTIAGVFNETLGTGITYPFSRDVSTLAVQMRGTANPGSPDVYADLAAAAGVTINALRQSFLVQQLMERDARGGTRYTEIVRSHFGVISPDARQQRPEYIGGGSSPFNITPVAQTATGGIGVGALGAAGTAVGQHRASYAATEHGYIIGIINVKSELSYFQGLHKMWTRQTRYDFYWPSLAGLGEQAVLRKEIYTVGNPALDDTIFGYQERWHEYRTRTSEVTGLFRPNVPSALVGWTLTQNFTVPPVLGQTFVQDNPDMARVLAGAVTTNQQYLADILIRRTAVRPIPTFGTPVTLGRF